MRLRTPLALGATLLITTAALTACGGSDDDASDASPAAGSAFSIEIEGVGTVEEDADLAGLLPDGIDDVTVATNAPYAPFIDFKTEGSTEEFIGLDYDIVTAIGARLGIETPFEQQPFDGLVPGLQADNWTAIVGGITDNKERQQTATFVDYSASGTGVMVAKGNPEGIETLEDLCGTEVAVQKAAKQVDLLKAFSDESCGGSAITVTEYPQNTDALNALLAEKAVAFVATKVNLVEDAAKVADKVEVVEDADAPNGYEASPNGIGFLKAESELAEAFRAALQSLIDDGTYSKIFAKWEQEPIAIEKATIDQAID